MSSIQRLRLEFDVVIVGAGSAGLSAAIRIAQKAPHLSVAVLEKGAEVGSHILSGAVVDPSGIDFLFPAWKKEKDHPFTNPVTRDDIFFLGKRRALRLPSFMVPHKLRQEGAFVVSLGKICRWLAERAQALGVHILSSVSVVDCLFDNTDALIGVLTGDSGITCDGSPGSRFTPGAEVIAKYVLVAEGARGSLASRLIKKYRLDEGSAPQKYALGIKELWRVPAQQHRAGFVGHFLGWPLDSQASGGGFLYHLQENLVSVGLVVHLDYENPYLSPFEEFQRFKTHPFLCPLFHGARRLSYGARAISCGGWQSVPKLFFPGGALLGCAVGFVNLVRIKGFHNAVFSGILVADQVVEALARGRAHDTLDSLEKTWSKSPIGEDLWPVRNFKPLLERFGAKMGLLLGGIDLWSHAFFKCSPFGTLSHRKADADSLKPALSCKKIHYPPPDGIVTFDRFSSLYLSGVQHVKDQPSHLRIADPKLQESLEYDVFAGPSARYCPAGVYEWLQEEGRPKLVVHPENCLHCKACDIKDPGKNIEWSCPQGGGGPLYSGM